MRNARWIGLVVAVLAGMASVAGSSTPSQAGVRPVADGGRWAVEGDQAASGFGNAAGTAGDVNGDGYGDVIVGAYSFDSGETDEGRAFVYHGSAGGPSTTPDWTAESDEGNAHFGDDVSTAGDVNGDGYDDVIVGAPQSGDEGRTFVYQGSADGLSTTPDWTRDGGVGDVGTAGDVNGDGYDDVIVGDYRKHAALVFHGSAAGLSVLPDWIVDKPGGEYEAFAIAVGLAGDVDGDGYDDVIVGAPSTNNGEIWQGAVYLFRGSPDGLRITPAWRAYGEQQFALLGESVGTAGDVNGDGYADLTVSPEGGGAMVYVFHGSASGPGPRPNWRDRAQAIGATGDVNGDGYGDAIVGYPGHGGHGGALVLPGAASGLGQIPIAAIEGDEKNVVLGSSVGTAGDVDADGHPDILVADAGFTHEEFQEGAVYVYRGLR